MNMGKFFGKLVSRVVSPEAWALGVLVLFGAALQARGPEGPALQLQLAGCEERVPAQAVAPLDSRHYQMAEKIDSRTERVWRRLEQRMRQLEERLSRTPGACSDTRGMRASMFE
jgi:hypothetical protein